MIISIVFIILGFLFLIKGADWMIRGATLLAKKNNISDLAIGLTIVAFGTSAPEVIVNIIASFEGHSEIVFGNVIGSNNFNLFIILGISGLILPITVQSKVVKNEIPISLLAGILLLILVSNFFSSSNGISRLESIFLLLLFGLFLFYIYNQAKDDPKVPDSNMVLTSNLRIWFLIIIGLIGLMIGGKLVVDNAVNLATSLGISKKVIGLTIIAAGTSLPELVTSVVAALKKNSDMVIGNVIGSNIFNILFVLSTSALIYPLDYTSNFDYSIYFFIGGTVFLLFFMFTGKRLKLDRWEASLLLIAYIIFSAYLIGK
ncbi:calcium/sodium antiporter [Flavivirga amylovorans]|uniref:Calcium/sodium antiporter n=1 Tax=Flavivirga amylovorans TaxID=870486 RepID=A0ABT8X6X5_9FLAO|nr:calcium/sodium antiporter [Flavivirga amylovorans]MDO5989760.1 calcium/sodium antiporter [Flavivirga amylovorans]